MKISLYLVLRVYGHFEGVCSSGKLSDVNPLTVDVGVVNVLAPSGDALVAIILAVIDRINTVVAVIILQTEACLVSLYEAVAQMINDFVMSKNLPHQYRISKSFVAVRSDLPVAIKK